MWNSRKTSRWILSAFFVLSATLSGCGYPVAQPVNREIISSLRTACSARNPEWLAANADKIEKQRSDGLMNDAEHETFNGIVAQARGGDWEGAEYACLAFQKAQRPTPEQEAKIRAFHEK
jgi:hypothetical protein